MYPTILLLLLPLCSADSAISGLLVSHPENHSDLPLRNVSGTAPAWLSGTLYRTGPGLLEHGNRSVNNLMDGLSKVHAWHFPGDGSVRYTASMLRTGVYNKTMSQGYYAAFPVMGDINPDFTLKEKIAMMSGDISSKDNTNIAIWDLDDGDITITTESPVMNQMTPNSLQYKGQLVSPAINLGTRKNALFSATHFAKHPSDGSSYNYVAFMEPLMLRTEYVFYKYEAGTSGMMQPKKLASIPVSMRDMRIVHQFGITENFLFVPRFNYKISFSFDLLENMSHFCKAMVFEKKHPTYMDIISLKTGEIHQFELAPLRGVHIMNTFERTNPKGELEVVMDVPITHFPSWRPDIPEPCLFDVYKIPLIEKEGHQYQNTAWNTTLTRVIYNMDTKQSSLETFPQTWTPVDTLIEFPFINSHYVGKQYCYCYLMQWHMGTMAMSLLKYDVCAKESISWSEEGKHIMEPVFVPRTEALRDAMKEDKDGKKEDKDRKKDGDEDIRTQDEDDGVVISPVFDSTNNSTELIVWNAKDLSVVARYDNLVDVPITIHGLWFDSKNKKK